MLAGDKLLTTHSYTGTGRGGGGGGLSPGKGANGAIGPRLGCGTGGRGGRLGDVDTECSDLHRLQRHGKRLLHQLLVVRGF